MLVLRNKQCRRLFIGQTFSVFGDTALYLALGLWIKDLTGSNAAASAIFLAVGLPSIFHPMGGLLVDRFRRKVVLLATTVLTGLCCLALLAVRTSEQLWIIYGFAALYGASLNITSAAQGGLLKDLLPDSQLGSANATFATMNRLVRIISPISGAALYSQFGGKTLALVDFFTFLVASLVFTGLTMVESSPIQDRKTSLSQKLSAGFHYVRADPLLAGLALVVGCALLVSGFWEASIFALVEHIDRPASFVGVLLSIVGVGGVLGATLVAMAMRRVGEVRVITIAFAGYSIGTLLLTTGSVMSVLCGTLIEGFCIPWALVGFLTVMQRRTPPHLQGRVVTLANTVVTAPLVISIGIGMSLVDTVGVTALLLTTSIVVAGCASVLYTRYQTVTSEPPAAHTPALLAVDNPART